MKRASSKGDNLPQNDEQWLSLEGFKHIYIPTTAGLVKGVLIEPPVKKNTSITIMSGGIPRRAADGEHIPLLGTFFAELARKLQGDGSTSLIYVQPGVNDSAGRVGDFTIGDRIMLAQEVAKWAQAATSSKYVNMLSTSMGAYIALRASYELLQKGVSIQQLVLISPAAYPRDIEAVAMGESFQQYASIAWEWSDTCITKNLWEYLKANGRLLFYAYEYDDPPIPTFIQKQYEAIVAKAKAANYDANVSIIKGVKHDFRRLDTTLAETATDKAVVIKTAQQIAKALMAHNI